MRLPVGAEVLVFLLLTVSIRNRVHAQNCAIPRVVRISSEIPELTETASPGTVLVKMSSHNIKFAEVIPFSPTNFIGLHINQSTKELVLTLERPLKNYLDDSRSATVDFQANLICADGRNKTVIFQIPFKDENTKVPQFSKREYNGTITLPILFENQMTTPLDLNIAIFDEDRDEKNAVVCAKVVEAFHSDAIGVTVISQPRQLIPQDGDGPVIPDQYAFDVSLYIREGFEEYYKSSAEIKFKLITWNSMSISKAGCLENTGGATNYADVTVTLISDGVTIPVTTQNPVTEISTPPTELVCYIVKFTSFYYKTVIKNLGETGERLELEGILPTKISAVSSSGKDVEYDLVHESNNFRIDLTSGRIYFKRVLTEEDVESMEDRMTIVEIRASDGDSIAVAILVVVFDIDKEILTTPSVGTTLPVCPPCPTPETPTTPIPGECPEIPECPTPITCPTDPPATSSTPPEFTDPPEEEPTEQATEVSIPSTVSPTTDPSEGDEGCSNCTCSTFTCPGGGRFRDPFSCTSFFNCHGGGDQGTRQSCPRQTVFCPLTGNCEWNWECPCYDPEPPCCEICPCELGDLETVTPDPSCSTPRPVPPGPCYDHFNNPYIELIPHPNKCEHYMQCVESRPGEPVPMLRNCAADLLFNFETCQCDWPSVAVCFDPYRDAERRLKCAMPLAH